MRRILASIVSIMFLFVIVIPVFAEDSSATTSSGRKALREQLASNAAERKQAIKGEREKLASQVAQLKEQYKAKMAEMRVMHASKAAELKSRLEAFKDQKKAAIVERVNNTLNIVNEKRTTAMGKHVDDMTKILNKLKDRVAAKKTAGKDTAQADDAIASASAAIASASAAVDAQALKDYTINVSSESGAKADAKKTRDRLHTDLQAVRKLLVDARQALANAIRVAATTLGGIGDGK